MILASQDLASSVLNCQIYGMGHGFDYRTVETYFDVEVPDHVTRARLLFKNGPWKSIRERIAFVLQERPLDGDIQR